MNTSVISFQNMSFSYGSTPVLQDVNFEVLQGDFIGIFGPNGGGKTTLFKLIMGFLSPSKGEVFVFGGSPFRARKAIGYVPQVIQLDRSFPVTVEQVVEMGLLGFQGDMQGKVDSALDLVGLASYKKTLFGALSGGQAQRVLIARAIVSNPELLLLDEPTAHADPCAEEGVYELLLSLKSQMTILMVTHHLSGWMDTFSKLLCVHRHVVFSRPELVCQHVQLGLYHGSRSGV